MLTDNTKKEQIERDSLVDVLGNLKTTYENLFANNIKADDAVISVITNTKKASKEAGSVGSITFSITKEGKKKRLSATMYVMEARKGYIVMFVNNSTYDIIFKNTTEAALDRAEKYVLQFVKRIAESENIKKPEVK